MQVRSLEISGFRGIRELHLDFSEGLNVLVGSNGVGKSAILDCTAILLSRLAARIRSSTGTGNHFSLSDINNSLLNTTNEISITLRGKHIHWTMNRNRRGQSGQFTSQLTGLKANADALRERLSADHSSPLPLFVYYPVNRAVLDIPLRIRKRHQFDRLAAYDQALSRTWSTFRIFFEWFREREDLENELRIDNPKFRDMQLQSVRRAIEHFLPNFRNLKVKRSPLRMVVDKDDTELVVSQLSDGEKCLLAMVGDLARRMAIANPHFSNTLACEAIVLIDEVELHLHPAWQRTLCIALRETFPNAQFILSTNSPAILGHLSEEDILVLRKRGVDVVASRPRQPYGKAIDRILEDIMDVSARPAEIEGELSKLFLKIERDGPAVARQHWNSLTERLGTDPALTKADLLIRRKEATVNEEDGKGE